MNNKPVYSIDAPDQQKLKVARAEIEAIMKKHDLGGCVMLHTPGMGEFFYNLTPSYSCAWIDENLSAFRVRSKIADYGGDAAAQLHDASATANLMAVLADMSMNAAGMFRYGQKIVDGAFYAEHTPARSVPDPAEQRRQ